MRVVVGFYTFFQKIFLNGTELQLNKTVLFEILPLPLDYVSFCYWTSMARSTISELKAIKSKGKKIIQIIPVDGIKKLRQWNPISLYYVKRLLVLTYQSYHSLNTKYLNI